MTYNNPDPGVGKNSLEIAAKTAAYFEQEIKRVIDNRYYHKSWTVLSTELRRATIDEIRKIFFAKLAEMKRVEKLNDWRYKSQDQTYPELKEDLRKIYPGLGDCS